jgi:hypothetical protein
MGVAISDPSQTRRVGKLGDTEIANPNKRYELRGEELSGGALKEKDAVFLEIALLAVGRFKKGECHLICMLTKDDGADMVVLILDSGISDKAVLLLRVRVCANP